MEEILSTFLLFLCGLGLSVFSIFLNLKSITSTSSRVASYILIWVGVVTMLSAMFVLGQDVHEF